MPQGGRTSPKACILLPLGLWILGSLDTGQVLPPPQTRCTPCLWQCQCTINTLPLCPNDKHSPSPPILQDFFFKLSLLQPVKTLFAICTLLHHSKAQPAASQPSSTSYLFSQCEGVMGTEGHLCSTFIHYISKIHKQSSTLFEKQHWDSAELQAEVYPAQVTVQHVFKQQCSPLCSCSTISHQSHLSLQCQAQSWVTSSKSPHTAGQALRSLWDCHHLKSHPVPSCSPSSAPVTLSGDLLSPSFSSA